jgi:hypothetical protein
LRRSLANAPRKTTDEGGEAGELVGTQGDGDWHVLLIADIERGDASFTQAEAAALMDPLTVTLTLDGAALATTRTAVKRFLNAETFGFVTAYYFQEGRIMSPTDLGVGYTG